MVNNELIVINNEKVSKKENAYYSRNYNLKILPEGLNDFLNVKYIISPVEISHQKLMLEKKAIFQSVNGKKNVYIYHLDQSNPRAWFVKDVIKEDQNLYNYLNASAFNPSKTAIVNKLENSRYSVGKILNIDWDIEKIIIDYEAKEKGILVLSEIYYPARWKAYIDLSLIHI